MTTTKRIPLLTLSLALLFSGCSKKEEAPQITEADVEAAADVAAKKAVAESDAKNQSKLAQLKKDGEAALAAKSEEMEKKMAEEKAKMEQELKAQLKEQADSLKAQFTQNNAALKTQLDSLTEKYNALKDKLPENVVDSISAKLPELRNSLGNLESIASSFNPNTLEQLQEFKTKYEKELALAKKVADELLKLLGKGSLSGMLNL